MSCAKTSGLILTIYVLFRYDVFLCKELPFGSLEACPCVKNFSGVNVFNCDSFLNA